MQTLEIIKKQCQLLGLSAVADQVDELANTAASAEISYLEFLKQALDLELDGREKKNLARRQKLARLPLNHHLENYDTSVEECLFSSKCTLLISGDNKSLNALCNYARAFIHLVNIQNYV